MRIYFTASVLQKDIYGDNYDRIVAYLESKGHEIIHEHITARSLASIDKLSEDDNKQHYKKVQKWISDCDLIVAEVSFPSTLNVGHEITIALDKGKTVVALYSQGKVSTFFQAIKSDKLIYQEYTKDTLESILEEGLEYAQGNADTRFNFIVPRSILDYLDWVSQHKNLPRSVYLRNLIEQDMKKNKEYTK